MPRERPLEVGDTAPDVTLRDSDRRPVTLSEYFAGRIGVIVFFPWAFTSVCTAELCAVRDRLPDLHNEASATVSISCDAPASLRELRAQQGFEFPLLSDHWPHGQASAAFGVFDPAIGAALRGTFIVDADLWCAGGSSTLSRTPGRSTTTCACSRPSDPRVRPV